MTQYLFLLSLLALSAMAADEPARHLVLVSVDGLRPEFYQDTEWPAPVMQRLAREGRYAKRVETVFPSVTYPAHTTMVTGALPAKHGIYYNSPFDQRGYDGRWYWYADAIKVRTLWQAVRTHGKRVAAVGWPVSAGSGIDFNLPEIWTPGEFSDFAGPVRRAATPGLLDRIEDEASGPWTDARMANDYSRRDLITAQASAWLLTNKKPALTLWHALAVDHAQHEEGRDSSALRESLSAVDAGIGLVLDDAIKAGLEDQLTVIITGDHGFADKRARLSPNVLLHDAGMVDNPKQLREWRAVFVTAGGAAFLHVNPLGDGEVGPRVLELLEALPADDKALFDILDRKQLSQLGAAPEALLALAPKLGATFDARIEQPWRQSTSGGQHGHLPQTQGLSTGFVIWGAGVVRGAPLETLHLADIAPIAATVLGIEFEAPDGKLPRSLVLSPTAD